MRKSGPRRVMAALVADYSSSESEGEPERGRGPGAGPGTQGEEGTGTRAGPGACGFKEPGDGGPQRDPGDPPRLPPPELEGGRGQAPGVFANPFAQERRQRLSLLEKHVRLTVRDRPERAGGRPVCLAYRRDGRCRYGSNCKFSHDSDLPDPPPPEPWAGPPPGEEGEGPEPPAQRGRKRPGLSPTLVPPKRSLKNYRAQRAKEGPGLL
ncbi:collagen alpha-1(VII) chain [Heptranchias perlo]|uniref:collagen alpha-1(VII) chain n=1 Tax=Heptranchias perlo TaxID=212740 RepID=UPI00355A5F78